MAALILISMTTDANSSEKFQIFSKISKKPIKKKHRNHYHFEYIGIVLDSIRGKY